MENNDFIEQLREFLDGSKTYAAVTFDGMYNMPNKAFLKALRHFLATGENVLDEYTQMKWLGWQHDHIDLDPDKDSEIRNEYFTDKECSTIMRFLAGESFWDIYQALETDQLRVLTL